MSNVSEWSTTASSNNATPPDGWPEQQDPSTVNNCAREMMAALKKWYADQQGTLVTTGSASAYVLSTNSSHAALNDLSPLVVRFNHASTGASTINVDSLGVKSLVFANGAAVAADDINADDVGTVVYDANSDKFFVTIGRGASTGTVVPGTFEARLSNSASLAVVTSDTTAATSVYLHPYKGELIALYTGSAWTYYNLNSALSLSLSGLTADRIIDVFLDYYDGTPALAYDYWDADADVNTRVDVTLTTQDGVYVKSGDTQKRYAGTVRINSTGGQTDVKFGSSASGGGETWIGIWNNYNRVPVSGMGIDSTSSWSNGTAAWEEWNSSTTNRVSAICGLAEEAITISFNASAVGGSQNASFNIARDSVSTPNGISAEIGVSQERFTGTAKHADIFPLGWHYWQMMEYGGTGITFYGSIAAGTQQCGWAYDWRY